MPVDATIIRDKFEMEIFSTRPQTLSLEARHTISLEVSKQRRLRVAKSLFLPRNTVKQILPTIKEVDNEADKEENIMSIRPPPQLPQVDKNESAIQSSSLPSSSTIDNPGLGVITYCPAPNLTNSKNTAKPATNSRKPKTVVNKPPESLAKKNTTPRRNTKKAVPAKDQNPQIILKDPNNNLPVRAATKTTTTACQTQPFPPNFNPPLYNYQIPIPVQVPTDHIIEISSDEEDTKVFAGPEQLPPPWRVAQVNNGLPRQNMPTQSVPVQGIPMQNFQMQNIQMQNMPFQNMPIQTIPNMYTGNHQSPSYQQYPPGHSVYFRPMGYAPQMQYIPGFCQGPMNYQQGFYTESHPNNNQRPQAITMPNYMSPEIRYRPYQCHQRPTAEPYHQKAQQLPTQQLQAQSGQLNSNYPTNVTPVEISKWMQSKYLQQNNPPPQMNYMPMSRQPEPQPYQALLPVSPSHQLQAFYDRMHDIFQAGQGREMPTTQPTQCWPQDNGPTAVDIAISMMRDAGNPWNNSQAKVLRRTENNQGPVNISMPQKARPMPPPTCPAMQADSTTGGNSPTSTANRSRIFVKNMSNFSPVFPPNSQNYFNPDLKLAGQNCSTMSPAMNQLSLNENLPEGFYRNIVNIPEYDPRDSH